LWPIFNSQVELADPFTMTTQLAKGAVCFSWALLAAGGMFLVGGCHSSTTTNRGDSSRAAASEPNRAGADRTARNQARDSGSADERTFTQHIAPIVYQHCAPCHRPGEAAPFSLLTFHEVEQRAEQIVDVTQRRLMPPWLPEPGEHPFRGERRLAEEQIEAIRRWVEAGAPQGDPRDLPPAPTFTAGWQLGQPDLVIEMDQPFTLSRDGTDVFRNFVIPIPVGTTKFVRAVELRPGNKQVVHHANMLIDRTPSSRRLDAQDPEPGFPGMAMFGEAEIPEGHFLNWKPGTPPFAGIDGKAWRLDKGTDLIVNLHMLPSGKSELVDAKVGLYFADKPPTGHPLEMLQLENDRYLDIPPGDETFEVADEFTLPVDVEVYGIYPHAHYLGKCIEGYAVLPDGRKKSLIHIKQWDFNWQAVYRYVEPVSIPRGSILHMRWTYDNSAANAQNPAHPPRRVRAGNGTYDEMSHLWIQMLTDTKADLTVLKEAIWQHKLSKYPDNASFRYNLGVVFESQGKLAEAADQFQRAVRIDPSHARAVHGLAMLAQKSSKWDEATRYIERSLRLNPDFAEARVNLAVVLMKRRKFDQAAGELRRVLKENPDYLAAHTTLGIVAAERGDLAQAQSHLERALAIHPQSAEALFGLALLEERRGNMPGAVSRYRQALEAQPDHVGALINWGSFLAKQQQFAEAEALYRRALGIDPRSAEALDNLGLICALRGQIDRAMELFQQALSADPDHVGAHMNSAKVAAQRNELDQSAQHCRHVIRIDPNHAEAYNQLGAVLVQQGKPREAEAQFLRALELEPNNVLVQKRLATVRAMLRDRPR
jgi:tetratricopeptide (TPR) repeat protein/mono/diheme cytochrome c family protein